ncbi:MAG TPA: hypothetical protein PLV92_20735, partial [Pirellulaceae bacterium]|nr:hypothetical protein [Pirellulaceae bacterium]
MTAGSDGGHIAVDKSLMIAADRVELTAAQGEISSDGGLVAAPTVYGRAFGDITAALDTSEIDFESTGAGDITLTNWGDATLSHVATADGAIDIEALGSLAALDVEARGSSASNSIVLTTHQFGANSGDLHAGNIRTPDLGDVDLQVAGALTAGTTPIVADHLSIDAASSVSVNTSVRLAAITTRATGDVAVHQSNTRKLTIADTRVMNGSLSVTHPNGDVELAGAVVATNDDTHDITVVAGGDILVGFASAGEYYASAADVPAPTSGAQPGATSRGDISLTAGGQIRASDSPSAVMLVVDDLTVHAQTGISGLAVAANRLLDVSTATGSIELRDVDGQAETRRELIVESASAAGGSVTIVAQGYLDIRRVVATGVGGAARLQSTTGDVLIERPGTGSAITVSSGIAVDAARGLQSYAFFTAPDLIEYRAGDYFDFDLTTSSLGIPSSLTSQSIVLERRSGLVIDQPLNVQAKRFELSTDGNLFVRSDITGSIDQVVMAARGTHPVLSQTYNSTTGQLEWVNEASGE